MQQANLFAQAAPVAPAFEPRPYQEQAVSVSVNALGEGVRRQVVHMATGTGKTVVFCEVMRAIQPPRPEATRVLALAHREELIEQAAATIRRMHPLLRVEVEQGSLRASPDADVVVASVPTLGRADGGDEKGFNKRLRRLNPRLYKMIWIDEVHHSIATTYQRILDYFDTANPESDILLWGCSATPNRTDKRQLNTLFDEIVFSYGMIPAIEDGWLARLRAKRILTDTNLANVKMTAGDYSVGQLAETINTDARNEQIVSAWNMHCNNGQRHSTLCFCADVAHVYALRDTFRAYGVHAEGADGTTDRDLRRDLVQGFRDREFPVLCNAMLFVEGTDIPCIDSMVMARPTQSASLFTQIVGRGTRLYPGKEDCLVLDMVDAYAGKNLMTVPSLFGMEAEFDANGGDIVAVHKKMEELFAANPSAVQAKSIEEAEKIVSEDIDLLGDGVEDDVIRKASRLLWRKIGDVYTLRMIDNRAMTIGQNVLGQYEVREHHDGASSTVRTRADLPSAINAADSYVVERYPTAPILLNRDARWMQHPMSTGQMDFFKRKHIEVPRDGRGAVTMTKGQAAAVIDAAIRRDRQKAEKWKRGRRREQGIAKRVDAVNVGRL